MAKRRHKKKDKSVRLGERATVERCQHVGGVTKEVVDRDASGKVYVWRYRVRVECILDAYLLRRLIELEQHEAGMRYRKPWLRARCRVKVQDAASSGYVVSYEDSLLMPHESERILRQADAVLTAAQRKVIIRVCGDDKEAGGTDYLETLRRGLDRLVNHFEIPAATKLPLPIR